MRMSFTDGPLTFFVKYQPFFSYFNVKFLLRQQFYPFSTKGLVHKFALILPFFFDFHAFSRFDTYLYNNGVVQYIV